MAQPEDDLFVIASEDTTLPLAGTSNKTNPRDYDNREYVTTQGFDKDILPCQEFNYILNNLAQWIQYVVDEYGVNTEGVLAPDNNLSDVSDAGIAFDNIKQSATTDYKGVVQKASSSDLATKVDTSKVLTTDIIDSLDFTKLGFDSSGQIDLSDTLGTCDAMLCVGDLLYLADLTTDYVYSLDLTTETLTQIVSFDDIDLTSPRGLAQYDEDGFVFLDTSTDEFILVDSSFNFVEDLSVLDTDNNSISNPIGVAYDESNYYVVSYSATGDFIYVYQFGTELSATGIVYDITELADRFSDTFLLGGITYLNGNFYIFNYTDKVIIKLDSTFSIDSCEIFDASDLGKIHTAAYSENTNLFYLYDSTNYTVETCQLDNEAGMVGIASTQECLIGTSESKVVPVSGIDAVFSEIGIGVGRTWQECTLSDDTSDYYRGETQTAYTNDTTTQMIVTMQYDSSDQILLYVLAENGDLDCIVASQLAAVGNYVHSITFMVPPDYSYYMYGTLPNTIFELR